MISKHLIPKISEFIEDTFGYEVVRWEEKPNASGFYRPEVRGESGKVSRNISIRIMTDSVLYIQDYAGVIQDKALLDLKTFTTVDKTEPYLSKEDFMEKVKIAKIEREKIYKNEIKKTTGKEYTNYLDELKKTETKVSIPEDHKAIEHKKIIPYSALPLGDDKVAVPYQDINGNIKGIQIRSKNMKWAIKGSSTSNAFCVIREGHEDPILKKKTILVSESWSTGCSIAQVRLQDTVVATASLNQVFNVCRLLQAPNVVVVAVLDKTVNNEENKMLSNEIEKLVNNKIPFIKPDDRFLQYTDYNDIRVHKGLPALSFELQTQLASILPNAPQILGRNNMTFQVLSPLGNVVIDVQADKLTPAARKTVASPAYWEALEKSLDYMLPKVHKVSETSVLKSMKQAREVAFRDAIVQKFIKEASRCKEEKVKRLGIFKDKGGYVLNTNNLSLYEKDDKIHQVINSKPLGGNVYIPVGNEPQELKENKNFSKEDLAEIYSRWQDLFGESTYSQNIFFAMLGFTVQGAYSSFSEFRSHMWLTGGSGSGKSRIVSSLAHYLMGGSEGSGPEFLDATKAYVLQEINKSADVDSSIMVIMDEMAADTPEKSRIVTEIVVTTRYMATRGSSSLSGRGSKDLNAKTFESKLSFMLLSTTHYLKDKQDLGRFTILELTPPPEAYPEEAFPAYYDALEKHSPYFLKLLVAEAKYYNEHTIICSKLLKDICSKYRPTVIGQKKRTIVSVVAGVSLVFKHIDKSSSKEACKKAIELMTKWVESQLEEHANAVATYEDLPVQLAGVQVTHNGISRPLFQCLCDPVHKAYFKNTFGISLEKNTKGTRVLRVLAFGNSVTDFFQRSKMCKPAKYGIMDSFKEYHSNGKAVKRKSSEGNRPIVYEVDIPKQLYEHFLSEDDEEATNVVSIRS